MAHYYVLIQGKWKPVSTKTCTWIGRLSIKIWLSHKLLYKSSSISIKVLARLNKFLIIHKQVLFIVFPNLKQPQIHQLVMVYPCNRMLLRNLKRSIDVLSNTNESQNVEKKEARLERGHSVWFYLHKIQELSKLIRSDRAQVMGCLEPRGLWLQRSMTGVGVMKMFLIVWWLWLYG